MLSSLKDWLLRRRREAEAKTSPSPPKPVNLTTAKAIVVLFPADDAADRKALDKWRDGFRKSGTKIKFTGYFNKPIGETNFGFPAVTPQNINWYGALQGDSVAAFRKLDCDVLLRLGPPEHPELDYLAVTKSAPLKVGPYRSDTDGIYHLQFDPAGATGLREQLAAIERIFSFTNAQ